MNFQARKENIAMQESGDETMVYDLLIDKAYLLNETSAFVWQMCDGKRGLTEISEALAKKTDQPVSEDVVKLAIDQLKANNLLDEPENIKDFFTKTSRRKVIRQVGLATMIALPAIFALTAPAATSAASSGRTAACQPCTQNSQCASGKCRTNDSVPPPYPKICSNASNIGYTAPPNAQIAGTNQTSCNNYAAQFCCAGNGGTFSGGQCRCNA